MDEKGVNEIAHWASRIQKVREPFLEIKKFQFFELPTRILINTLLKSKFWSKLSYGIELVDMDPNFQMSNIFSK